MLGYGLTDRQRETLFWKYLSENMMENDTDRVSIAVIASRVNDLRTDIAEFRTLLTSIHTDKVSYREWSQRNNEVNNRFSGLGREIGDLRTEIRAKSAPWWSVGALVTSAIALAWSIFGQ